MAQSSNPEDTRKRINELLSHITNATFDLDPFMDLTVNEVLGLTPATGVVVELAEGDEMVYRAATGTMSEFVGLRLPQKGSLTGLCVELGEVLYSEDTEQDTRVNREACRRVGARSMLVVPLFHLKKTVGVLKAISNKPNAFSENDKEILKEIAACLGSALSRQIYAEARKFF